MQSNFTTPRLKLSALTTANSEFILELVNTEGWLRFIGDRNIHSTDDAVAYINKINQNTIFKYWLVELKGDQTPIGIVTLIKRDYLDFHDIGFAFLPAYAKAGYAFEAASTILDYLVSNSIVDHLLATTIPDNVNSIRLLTKLGFGPEREIEVDGEKLVVYGLKK